MLCIKQDNVSPLTNPLQSKQIAGQSDEEFEQQCIFCGQHDDKFTPETLDAHYWKDCPVLVQCKDCNTVFLGHIKQTRF